MKPEKKESTRPETSNFVVPEITPRESKPAIASLTIITAILFIAVPVILYVGLTRQQPRQFKPAPPPEWLSGRVQLPNGSWCAERLPAVCVSATGDVYIPSGELGVTLDALGAICERMHGAPPACQYVLLDQGREIYTTAVSGRMSPDEALARMLEGTGLQAKGSFGTIVAFVPAPAN